LFLIDFCFTIIIVKEERREEFEKIEKRLLFLEERL